MNIRTLFFLFFTIIFNQAYAEDDFTRANRAVEEYYQPNRHFPERNYQPNRYYPSERDYRAEERHNYPGRRHRQLKHCDVYLYKSQTVIVTQGIPIDIIVCLEKGESIGSIDYTGNFNSWYATIEPDNQSIRIQTQSAQDFIKAQISTWKKNGAGNYTLNIISE